MKNNKTHETLKKFIKKLQVIPKVLPTKSNKPSNELISSDDLSEHIELRNKLADVKYKEDQLKLRKEYANKSFKFMCIWSICLGSLLLFYAIFCPKHLTQWVLVTLIGSTTISLFRMFGVIIHGLFPNDKKAS